MVAVVSIKRRGFDGGLVGIVVGEFRYGEERMPVVLLVVTKDT